MPRRRLSISTTRPYHVTARSNNKEWFYVPLPCLWEIFSEKLVSNTCLYGTAVHALVLMSNHFHMILTSPTENLGEVMRHLLTEISKEVSRRSKRINHVFGARYKWSLLESASSVAYVYKYVLRNPVRAGLTPQAEDYPFSTLHWPTDYRYPPIVEGIEPHWRLIPRDQNERRRWINLPVKSDEECLIQRGLRKATFQFSRGNDQRNKLSCLENSYGLGPGSISAHDRYLFGRKGD